MLPVNAAKTDLLLPFELVFLEWLESKSDVKFGFSMLKTPKC